MHNCCCFLIQLPHWHYPFITKSKSHLFLSRKTALRFNLYFTAWHLPIDPKIGFSLTSLKIFKATYYVMYYTVYKTSVLHLTEDLANYFKFCSFNTNLPTQSLSVQYIDWWLCLCAVCQNDHDTFWCQTKETFWISCLQVSSKTKPSLQSLKNINKYSSVLELNALYVRLDIFLIAQNQPKEVMLFIFCLPDRMSYLIFLLSIQYPNLVFAIKENST